MITKQREGGECGRQNFKDLVKSVAHYDDGDRMFLWRRYVCKILLLSWATGTEMVISNDRKLYYLYDIVFDKRPGRYSILIPYPKITPEKAIIRSLVFRELYTHNIPYFLTNFVQFSNIGVVELENGAVLCGI